MEKKSIYYYDINNVHRPNQQELQSNEYICPRCKSKIFKSRFRVLKQVFVCPCCGFEIEVTKVLEESQIDEAIEKKKNRKLKPEQMLKDIIEEAQINPTMPHLPKKDNGNSLKPW
jgi:ribosomal protein L37AE/L43A